MVKLIVNLIKFAIMVSLTITVIAGLGFAPFLGCYLRYPSQSGTLATTATVRLYGNGISSYNPIDVNATTSNVSYGQWTKVDLAIKGGSSLYFKAQGWVSLCKAYYPDTWIQEIPRVGDATWFNLKLPAANSTYTLTQVFEGDLVKVKIGPNTSSNTYMVGNLYDPTTQNIDSSIADCSDGQTSYDAKCGKYSNYIGFSRLICGWSVMGGQAIDAPVCICEASSNQNTISYSSSALFLEGNIITGQSDCSGLSFGQTSSSSATKAWFAFDQVSGENTESALSYRITNSSISGQTASIINNCASTNNATGCHSFSDRYIFDNSSSGGISGLSQSSGLLQYSFFPPPSSASGYTGGYVLSLQHTKCYRANGAYSSDVVYTDRGAVRYLLLDSSQDPNEDTATYGEGSGNVINFIAGDSSAQSIIADTDSVLWMRIDNKSSDYSSSDGAYQVTVSQNAPVSVAQSFDLWPWMNGIFKSTFGDLSTKLFQNLTCYGATDQSSCFNLFQVIRALLVAYIMVFAIFFLIGMIQVDYYDFIQRIIKITIIGGLISGKTFDFFNDYIFNIIFGFTDSLMNSAVFFPTTDNSSGLGSFTKAIFATLGQDIFQIQLLAMLGTGFTGVIMLVLILISLVLFLIPILNLMVITLVSYFFVQVLLGMTPIFLIFILFKPTQHIFKQWVTYIIAYLFEPVMLFMGIAILAKLFMIYLDYVLGYSVCFKCNSAFSIPFITSFFPMLDVVLNKMPIFCLYWISPWGYDTMSFNYGQAFTNIIALFSIANATYHYTSMCGKLVTQIFGVSTAGSQIAESMTKGAMQKAAQMAKKGASMSKAKGGGAGGAGGK